MDQAELMAFCVRVMGDSAETAIDWMTSKAIALNGKRPIQLIETQEGRDEVELLLKRIEGGVYI